MPNRNPLEILSFLPPDQATKVPLNSTVQATFSQPIDGLTLAFTSFALTPLFGGNESTFVIGPYTTDPTGKSVTFIPDSTDDRNRCPPSNDQASSGLCVNTTYRVRITVDLADIFGNRLAAEKTWTFSTGESLNLTPPSVVSRTPDAGAQGISPDTKITITFSGAVDPSSVTKDAFYLFPLASGGDPTDPGLAGIRIPGKITVTNGGLTAELEPALDLSGPENTPFAVILTGGIRDVQNLSLSGDQWSFTIGPDTVRPRVKTTSPPNQAKEAPLNAPIRANFSEPLLELASVAVHRSEGGLPIEDPIEGTLTLSGSTVTFEPSASLEPGREYLIELSGFQDQANPPNTMVDYAWRFQTCTLGCFPRFAYVANQGDDTLSLYVVDADTGRLRANGYVILPPKAVSSVPNPHPVATDPLGRFVYVGNHDSNNVSGYKIENDGTLTELIAANGIPGSPFPAGGGPVSVVVDASGSFVYVVNENSRTVSTYSIDAASGNLVPVPGADAALPSDSSPRSIILHPTRPLAFVASSVPSPNNLLVFRIGPSGALEAAPPVTAGIGPVSVAVEPSGRFLYVVNSASNEISAFSIQSDPDLADFGALTPVSGSPFGTQKNPNSIAIDPAGRLAFVANPSSNSVSTYTIDPLSGVLTPVFGSPFSAGTAPVSVAVDPSGRFVYVTNQTSRDVSIYEVNDGVLTRGLDVRARSLPGSIAVARGEKPVAYLPKFTYTANFGSNDVSGYSVDPSSGALTRLDADAATAGPQDFPAGTNPYAVAQARSGRFLYVANRTSSDISPFEVDPSSGTLTAIAQFPLRQQNSTPPLTQPTALVADPTGRYLFVAQTNSDNTKNNISVLAINPASGTLTAADFLIQPGRQPVSVAVDPSGQFLYVANAVSNTVSAYRINPSTGVLSSLGSITAGTRPVSIATDPSGQFVLVAYASSTSGIFSINATTGVLSLFITPTIGQGNAVTFDPTGKNIAYLITSLSNLNVIPFIATGSTLTRVGPISGNVTAATCFSLNGNPAVVAPTPPFTCSPFAVDPSGKFAYAANPIPVPDESDPPIETSYVSAYSVTSTGTLIPQTPQKVPAGKNPVSVTVVGEISTTP